MEASFGDFLKNRKEALSKYHPQWNLTNEEISSSSDLLKRDGTPICIPPSWDLVQNYAGPDDERADGSSQRVIKLCNIFYTDLVVAEFLDIFRNLKIGGVLIGDLRSEHFLEVGKLVGEPFFTLPKNARDVFKEEIKVLNFELDFVYFHSSLGILQFEIKKSGVNESKAVKQLNNNQRVLKQLFFAYGKLIDLDEEEINSNYENFFPKCSYLYFEKQQPMSSKSENCEKIYGIESLKNFTLGNANQEDRNFFKNDIFLRFLILMAGFRPDCFISPVKCALILKKNIFTNCVSTINDYRKDKSQSENIQNQAKTVQDFLKELKSIKYVEINYGDFDNLYLTPEQRDAVGFFDDGGNFYPQRQLIFGPPGSGKSLILMLKIFIHGQIEARKEKKLYFWTWSDEHAKQLSEFVSRNESKFCRSVKKLSEGSTAALEGADVILDEDWDGSRTLKCLSSRHDDQIIAVVCTGIRGNVTSKNYSGRDEPIYMNNLESKGFETTELQTVFRSTRQIQKFFNGYNDDKNKKDLISGHNFNGIKVEKWIFEGEETMKEALDERIRRLVDIEGCEKDEIGLFQSNTYGKPELINNVFNEYHDLRALAFPIMVVVEPSVENIYLTASRAVCHLIIFSTKWLEIDDHFKTDVEVVSSDNDKQEDVGFAKSGPDGKLIREIDETMPRTKEKTAEEKKRFAEARRLLLENQLQTQSEMKNENNMISPDRTVSAQCERSLRSVVRGNRSITYQEFRDWMQQIVDALHDRKIIHPGLTSEHVFLTSLNKIKIADDFESSNAVDKVLWMSPEMLLNQPCDQKANVWSFGVLAWEIITQQTPYAGNHMTEAGTDLRNHVCQNIPLRRICLPFPSGLNRVLRRLLMGCLHNDPKKRPDLKMVGEILRRSEKTRDPKKDHEIWCMFKPHWRKTVHDFACDKTRQEKFDADREWSIARVEHLLAANKTSHKVAKLSLQSDEINSIRFSESVIDGIREAQMIADSEPISHTLWNEVNERTRVMRDIATRGASGIDDIKRITSAIGGTQRIEHVRQAPRIASLEQDHLLDVLQATLSPESAIPDLIKVLQQHLHEYNVCSSIITSLNHILNGENVKQTVEFNLTESVLNVLLQYKSQVCSTSHKSAIEKEFTFTKTCWYLLTRLTALTECCEQFVNGNGLACFHQYQSLFRRNLYLLGCMIRPLVNIARTTACKEKLLDDVLIDGLCDWLILPASFDALSYHSAYVLSKLLELEDIKWTGMTSRRSTVELKLEMATSSWDLATPSSLVLWRLLKQDASFENTFRPLAVWTIANMALWYGTLTHKRAISYIKKVLTTSDKKGETSSIVAHTRTMTVIASQLSRMNMKNLIDKLLADESSNDSERLTESQLLPPRNNNANQDEQRATSAQLNAPEENNLSNPIGISASETNEKTLQDALRTLLCQQFKQGQKAFTAAPKINHLVGRDVGNKPTVQQLFKQFHDGHTRTKHKRGSGRPVTTDKEAPALMKGTRLDGFPARIVGAFASTSS